MSNNKIKPIREKIDAIDHQLLKLIQKRGLLAQKIGDLKGLIDSKASFYKPSREAEILRKLVRINEGPISDKQIQYIFKEIISSCLSLEEELTIAFLGPEGTHSESAAIQHFGSSPRRSARSTIEDVFHQVRTGEVNYGIVPVENSSEGVVNATLNCLADEQTKICGETYLAVHHQLASVKNDKSARLTWKKYRKKFAKILGDLELYTEKVSIPEKGTFHRVQAGVLNRIKAQNICSTLINKKQPCIITRIKSGGG